MQSTESQLTSLGTHRLYLQGKENKWSKKSVLKQVASKADCLLGLFLNPEDGDNMFL
jgi:S-adenosylmethionine:diacylglycerol 3-amino-3-carboxypropyl transferase